MSSPATGIFGSVTLRRFLFALGLAAICVAPFFQLHLVGRYGQTMLPGARTADSDLYAPWVGVRALLQRRDPYSPAFTRQIQADIYGNPLPPHSGRDPQAFVYPAYLVFLLGPFTFLPWPAVYRGAALLSPAIVTAFAWGALRLCRYRMNTLGSVIAILLILTSWPAVWSCYSRQPSLCVAAALVFALLLYRRGRETAAALLLAAATIKPQLMLLLGGWLLLHAITHRRYRFPLIFVLAVLLLVGGSLVLLPQWIPEWVRAALDYTRHSGKHSLFVSLAGRSAGLLLEFALLGVLTIRLRIVKAVHRDSACFIWAAALLLAATDCLIPANAWLVYNNLLLVPGVLLLFREQPPQRGAAALRALALICVLLGLLITPLCTVLAIVLGFSTPLALSPFLLHFLLPIPVTAALLALPTPPCDSPASHQSALQAGAFSLRVVT